MRQTAGFRLHSTVTGKDHAKTGTLTVARRKHTCDFCGAKIPKGDAYWRASDMKICVDHDAIWHDPPRSSAVKTITVIR